MLRRGYVKIKIFHNDELSLHLMSSKHYIYIAQFFLFPVIPFYSMI